ncbi:MAG: hypothetical protein ACYTGP_03975 [Planctomycetota bacterium]|jgi:hypothetical protein
MNTLLSLSVGGLLLVTPPAADTPNAAQPENATNPSAAEMPAETAATEYRIRLHRPMEVGQVMHVRGFGMQEQFTTAEMPNGTQPTQGSRLHVDFEAEGKVLAVDAKGRPSRVSYQVLKCEMRRDGSPQVIAEPGTTIVASEEAGATNKTIFEIDGRRVDSDAHAALTIVAALDNESMTQDEVLGTDQPRTVGESWDVNRAKMAELFRQQSKSPVAPENVSGTTTLTGVTTQDGYPCLVVHSNITTENAVPGIDDIPAGFEIEKGSMTMSIQQTLPEDTNLPSLSDSARMDLEFVIAGQSDPHFPIRMTCKFTQVVERDVRMLTASVEADPASAAPIEE